MTEIKKINTIIINKILIHMLDFEHDTIHLSDEFVKLNDTTWQYYHKKTEKALYNTQLKEVIVPSLHELLLRGAKMMESEEEFKRGAKAISERFFGLGRHIEAMSNANMFYVDCYQDGVHMLACLKVNYKYVPVTIVEDHNVRISKKQVLPPTGNNIDEAVLIDLDHQKIFILEKKYLIDGKMNFYLNEQWIKGEEKLTDRQKFNTMKKVVQRVDDAYHPNNQIESMPVLKQELADRLMNHDPIKPIEIVKKVMSANEEASDESELMLKDMGIGEEDVIKSIQINKMFDKCKIVTDNEIEITMPIEDYINEMNIEKVHNSNGTINIILKNINEIIIK